MLARQIAYLTDNMKFPVCLFDTLTPTVTFSFVGSQSFDTFVIDNHNLEGMGLRFSLPDNTEIVAWTQADNAQILKHFLNQSSQTVRLSIASTGEYPYIGEIFIGILFQPAIPVNDFDPTECETSTDVMKNNDGTIIASENYHGRILDVTYNSVHPDTMVEIKTMLEYCGKTKNLFFIPQPDVNPTGEFGLFFGSFTSDYNAEKTVYRETINLTGREVKE